MPYCNIIHFSPCEVIRESLGYWTPHCGFQIPGSGFRYPPQQIPDSKSAAFHSLTDSRFLERDPLFQRQDSEFHKQIFPWFQSPDYFIHGATIVNVQPVCCSLEASKWKHQELYQSLRIKWSKLFLKATDFQKLF